MQGIFLILYILVISGLIAVVGDRVGYRIGKKRLSWFKLRPRDTAVLVAVLTGVIISGLTLASLLLLSQSLRQALFNYEQTLAKYDRDLYYARLYTTTTRQQLALVQQQLQASQAELAALESNLSSATTQRDDAQVRLDDIKRQLQELLAQREATSRKLAEADQQLLTSQQQLAQATQQLNTIKAEASTARQQVKDLQQQQKALAEAKQALQLDRDQLERSLAASQTALSTLETQKNQLESEINQLNQVATRLRRGELAIATGEILAVGVIDADTTDAANLSAQLNQILAQAEQRARQLGAKPLPPAQTAIQIPKATVAEILNQIATSGSWVVRIFSISNRLEGELVPVGADVNANRLIYAEGSVIADTRIEAGQDEVVLQGQLLSLLSTANVRSQQAGLLANPLTGTVGEFSQIKLLEAVQKLRNVRTAATMQVVANRDIYTAGPLDVSLVMAAESSLAEQTLPKP
ncbi:MAG: DUF3084 domain-containing protein [Cyanobacteriota bacterium]|nr:DUF3084 domain-containing protein [Cyanobacteriota bacterium]